MRSRKVKQSVIPVAASSSTGEGNATDRLFCRVLCRVDTDQVIPYKISPAITGGARGRGRDGAVILETCTWVTREEAQMFPRSVRFETDLNRCGEIFKCL